MFHHAHPVRKNRKLKKFILIYWSKQSHITSSDTALTVVYMYVKNQHCYKPRNNLTSIYHIKHNYISIISISSLLLLIQHLNLSCIDTILLHFQLSFWQCTKSNHYLNSAPMYSYVLLALFLPYIPRHNPQKLFLYRIFLVSVLWRNYLCQSLASDDWSFFVHHSVFFL